MPDTAKRLAGPILLTNAAVTQYTVPASTTTTVRGIHIANTSTTAAVTAFLSIGADAAGTRFLSGLSIPAASTYDWSGFLVLATAQLIQAFAGTTNLLTLTISGIETT